MKNRRSATHTKATHSRKSAKAILSIFFSVMNVDFRFAAAIDNNLRTTKKMAGNNSTIAVVDDEYELMSEYQSWSSNILGNLCCSSCLSTFTFEDVSPVLEGSAYDVIIVESEDGSLHQNSDFLVNFKGENEIDNDNAYNIVMEVDQGNDAGTKAWFPIIQQPSQQNDNDQPENDDNEDDTFDEKRFWGCCHPAAGSAKPNMLSNFKDGGVERIDDPSSALKAFLKPGRNPIRYLLLDEQRVVGVAKAHIFLWKHSDSIVVSDIDGTITKSNVRGVLGTIISQQYEKVCHVGICQILSRLSSSSQVIYVTSRPIGLATQTRQFLSGLKQGNETLPDGPLLGFGGNLPQVLLMELVSKSTQRFKANKLWQQVVQPFRKATNNDLDSPVFIAGFGNNFMDVQSYHAVGMDLDRIFKISKRSQIVTFDKPDGVPQGYNGELDFPPHYFFKDRIGTAFDGYEDPHLISRLVTD
jgi:phosphatidate phosphatase LPIN